jgi:hypothetical protein
LTEKVKIRIDGEVIAATVGQTILEVARANEQVHPGAVLHGGPQRRRRVPAVHGRGLRRRRASCPPARLRCRRAWRSTPPPRSSSPIGRWRSNCCSSSAITSAPCAFRTTTASCRIWPEHGRDLRSLSIQLPATHGGHVAPALRAGPQPLHSLYPLRANVRRDGGCARVGHRSARHPARGSSPN